MENAVNINLTQLLQVLAILFTALIAGLFYSYSCSVTPGLGRLSDSEYLRAMQSINRAILNPWFFVSFMGTLVTLPLSAWMTYQSVGAGSMFYLILAATLVYTFGTFAVTLFGNIPLNQMLDNFAIGNSTAQEIKEMRSAFEGPWNRLNLMRTIANIISLLLFIVALIRK